MSVKKDETRDVIREVAALLVRDPEEIKNLMLAWALNFHAYSLTNVAWVRSQRHHRGIKPATYIESLFGPESKWKSVGRHLIYGVKKEGFYTIQKPVDPAVFPEIDPETKKQKIDIVTGKPVWIKIFKRFQEIQTYGYEHTYGKSLEDLKPEDRRMVRRESVRFDWFAKNAPIDVRRIPKGDKVEDGFTDGIDIVIADPGHKGCEAAMLATLFHKTAHVLMHGKNPELGEDIERSVRELEAVAVEYAVCCYFDIENLRAQREILQWAGSVEELQEKADRILTTAQRIIKHYEACAKEEASPCSTTPPSEEEVA